MLIIAFLRIGVRMSSRLKTRGKKRPFFLGYQSFFLHTLVVILDFMIYTRIRDPPSWLMILYAVSSSIAFRSGLGDISALRMFSRLGLIFTLSIGILITMVQSKTNSQDVSALNVMFTSLNSPSQLSGWRASGGDPCGDHWEGIRCSGSAVVEIKLSGLDLTGSMGYLLSNLKSVTYFDLSKNNLMNDIPYQLPPNAVHLDLSNNGFSGNVPYSISQMTDLEYLNLGHNHLNGQLSDMFQKLPKLKRLDLSYNSLSGNLPSSFGVLSSLNSLYLQNNQFTGMINVLAGLPLDELNLEDNRFNGWVPDELKNIDSIKTGGNSWSSGPSPPPPPGAGSASAKDSRKIHENRAGGGKHALNAVALTFVVLAALLIAALLIALFSRRTSSPSSHFLDEEMASHHRAFTPLTSQELSTQTRIATHREQQRERGSFNSSSTTMDMKSLQRSPSVGFVQSLTDSEFARRLSNRRSSSVRSAPYSLSELQAATGNFSLGRLLGEGSLGRVYRAKFSDGKDLVVKKIDSSFFQGRRPEEFSDIISTISRVRHPNVSELVGHCSEQGHNMLIYEFFRNGSLHEFLHLSDDYSKPLTWNTRIRIALGTARAIEYLHEVCSPSFIHKNIKSSNILLDLELNPRLSDYGLAVLHQRTSQDLGTGYSAPECAIPSGYTLKSDIYSFGVVMLELLTGRMPLDKSRAAKAEQCLVRWASPELHDTEALAKMVDPALRGLYPPKSLSRFADIIALCVQEEQEFRPAMSEVVQALVRLVQRSSMNMRDDLAASRRTDDSDCY